MISSFFVLSPRGDTILSKMYRTPTDLSAHERSHTEAFFRKIKFWNTESRLTQMNGYSSLSGGAAIDAEEKKEEDIASSNEGGDGSGTSGSGGGRGIVDPPPVFIMPDGQSYFHINKNGLIFACASNKNVSPCLVIEVRFKLYLLGFGKLCTRTISSFGFWIFGLWN